jgi:hypothetical protein
MAQGQFLIKSPSLMEKKLPGGCQGTSRPEPRGGKQKRVFFTGRAETDSMILCCCAPFEKIKKTLLDK